MTDERRLALVWVDPISLIMSMQCAWQSLDVLQVVQIEGVPEDARVVNVFHDPTRRALGFVLEHESFEPHLPGQMLRELVPFMVQQARTVVIDERVGLKARENFWHDRWQAAQNELDRCREKVNEIEKALATARAYAQA